MLRPPFSDPPTQRRLERLVAVTYPRGPAVVVQLLTNVAVAIGGAPAILGELENLAAQNRGRRAIRGASR
jgi:hypothetical protein